MKIIELLLLAVAPVTSSPTTEPAPGWFTALSNPMVLVGAVLLLSFMFMG